MMCRMNLVLVLLITAITFSECLGQSIDSVKIKRQLVRQTKAKQRRDSLEAIFNSTPPFYEISLEINQQKTSIPQNAKFYATDGSTKFESHQIQESKFGFERLPDSVRFVLELDSVTISTGLEKKNFYTHGAQIRFGYFDNALALRKQWRVARKNDDYDEWNEIGIPYLGAIKDKRLVKSIKRGKISLIEFAIFSPRTWGDGVIHSYLRVRGKKLKVSN